MQENPDDPYNYDKWEEENQKWGNNVEKALRKYGTYDKWEEGFYSSINLSIAFRMARDKGDYDAAAILRQAYINAKENEKAKKEEKSAETTATEKPAKEGKQTFTKEKAWEIYNSPTGTATGLFENFNTLGLTAEEARKEFLSKNPNPSEAAKKHLEMFINLS